VRPAVAAAVPAPPDTPTLNALLGPTQFIPAHQTRQDVYVSVVSGVPVRISFNEAQSCENGETAAIDTELTGYRGIRGAILSVKLLLDRPWWFPGGKPATGSAV